MRIVSGRQAEALVERACGAQRALERPGAARAAHRERCPPSRGSGTAASMPRSGMDLAAKQPFEFRRRRWQQALGIACPAVAKIR